MPLKASLHWDTVAWKRKERGQAQAGKSKDGGMQPKTTLGVQMARCFMCGLNGSCQSGHYTNSGTKEHANRGRRRSVSQDTERIICHT